MGGGAVHRQNQRGVCAKPQKLPERGTEHGGPGCLADVAGVGDLPDVGSAGDDDRRRANGTEHLRPTVRRPHLLFPSCRRVEQHETFGRLPARSPIIGRRGKDRRPEGGLARDRRISPEKLCDVILPEFGIGIVRKEDRVVPPQLAALGDDQAAGANGRQQGSERGFVERVKTVRAGFRGKRKTPSHSNPAHQIHQIGMPVAGQQAHRRTVVIAQLRKGWLEQDEVPELLVKGGVTSGHGTGTVSASHPNHKREGAACDFLPSA